MSKTIDALNKSLHSSDKIQTSIQEEIAKTYFQTPSRKKERKKATHISKIPWIVTSLLLFAITLVIIFGSLQPHGLTGKGIFFIKGSEPNKDIIKNISFLGDAVVFSRVRDDEMVLCNSKGHGWANYTIELKKPINLSKYHIKYTAKGQKGDEHLVLVVVDANNRSYRMGKNPSLALTKDWQGYDIDFEPLRNLIDLKAISVIRFEFGSLTTGNDPTATIFLKDIHITKT